MLQEEFRGIDGLVYYFLPIMECAIRSYCFCRFVQPFLASAVTAHGSCSQEAMETSLQNSRKEAKKGAALGGAAYFLTMLMIYTMRLSMDAYVIYGLASLAMFLAICRMDRRNYRQKAFLVIICFSLSWFAASMAEILYDFLYDSATNTDYMQSHPEMSLALYLLMCAFYLALETAFTAAGTWQVARVYRDKEDEMGRKELAMLSFPSLTGVTGYEIMRYYRRFYVLETGRMERSYDSLTLLFCAISSIAIIVAIRLYQGIRLTQEERQQGKLLEEQLGSIRRHIRQVESLYQDIRSLRHDMTNHILTLERLYEKKETAAAQAYSKGLKAQLAQAAGGAGSGNPVTDVILQEFAKEAEKKDILFRSEFYYPKGAGIDAFDVSIILHNALQNALENTESGTGREISIVSYRRDNAYLIEIRNSYMGSLRWNAESGLPATSKEQAGSHGYGLPNIRKVAGKYAGDIDVAIRDGVFCLCVLLIAGE